MRTLSNVMDNSRPAEVDLWERARLDDGDAFGALFDIHHTRVFHRALGLMANKHDAEDVAAAVFFELWRKRRSVRLVNASVLPWLLVTTVNLSRNARRATSRYERVIRGLPREEFVAAPDAAVVETKDRLADALQQLSAVDGALFVLTAFEDLPLADAAAAVGLKPSTARMRLSRARERLRSDLHDLHPAHHAALEGNC